MSCKLLDFAFREEGELIPEGVSLTQTSTAWYVRVRDHVWGIRVVMIPKSTEMINEKKVISLLLEQPPQSSPSLDDFLENHNDGYSRGNL